jgi:flagellar motor switch protein FliM
MGELSGMMNLAVPSITVKMLGQKFDQQWHARKTETTSQEHDRALRLIRNAKVLVDSRLRGPTLSVDKLLSLSEGDILAFDFPVNKPIEVSFNGRPKYVGQVVAQARKRCLKLGPAILATD